LLKGRVTTPRPFALPSIHRSPWKDRSRKFAYGSLYIGHTRTENPGPDPSTGAQVDTTCCAADKDAPSCMPLAAHDLPPRNGTTPSRPHAVARSGALCRAGAACPSAASSGPPRVSLAPSRPPRPPPAPRRGPSPPHRRTRAAGGSPSPRLWPPALRGPGSRCAPSSGW
jgi:hypothetical protein